MGTINETIKTLINRQSCRSFKDEQIKDEQLDLILEAGMNAANAMGKQSPKIVVIQNEDTIKDFNVFNAQFFPTQFREEVGEVLNPLYGAKTLLIVLADKNLPTHVQDGSLVLGNMMNAAYSLGIGSCWIHRAQEEFESEEGKNYLKQWNIPDNYAGIGHLILGYPKEDEKPKAERKADYVVRVD